MKLLINIYFMSNFNYCNLSLDDPIRQILRTKNLQNRAFCFLLNDFSSTCEGLNCKLGPGTQEQGATI